MSAIVLRIQQRTKQEAWALRGERDRKWLSKRCRMMMHALGAGWTFCREGICNVKLVNFCPQALSYFGVTTLLRHHHRKVYKDMLFRLRWGSVPMGPPATHSEPRGTTHYEK